MEIDVKEKVILITGASRGIGKELAIRFAREGAYVIINYHKNEAKARELLAEIECYNKNCIIVKADVANADEVKQMYHTVVKRYSRLDFLINNAGLCNDNRIQLMSLEQWDDIINVNLKGTFLCCKYFSKLMIHQGYGKIINIASLKGQQGCIGQTNYSASKNGLIGFTKSLAKELGAFNIAVNAICPGFVVTDLNRHNSEKIGIAKSKSVLDIIYTLDDLTNFILWICSDCCRGVSGQVFNLDSRIN